MQFLRIETTPSITILLTAVFLLLTGNLTFFSNFVEAYPLDFKNGLYMLSVAILSGCINVVLLSLLCYRYTTKVILIALLLISAATAYFMDTYHVIFDGTMIDNVVRTDVAESIALLSFKLLLLGVLPSALIFKDGNHALDSQTSDHLQIETHGYCNRPGDDDDSHIRQFLCILRP